MPNDRQASAEPARPRTPQARRVWAFASHPQTKWKAPVKKAWWLQGSIPKVRRREHGLQPGDVILNVGGKAVANVGDVRAALEVPPPAASAAS